MALILRNDKAQVVLAVCAVGVVHAALFAILPKGGIPYSDNGLKYLHILSLTTSGHLAIARNEAFSALRHEVTGHMVSVLNGQIYAGYPATYALLVAPFFAILGVSGLTIPSVISIIATAWCTGLCSLKLRYGVSWLAVLLAGLLTPYVFYAHTLWEHLQAVACIAAGLWLWLRGDWPISGLCFGVAIWFSLEVLIFTISLLAVAMIVLGCCRGIYQFCRFGSGLAIGILLFILLNVAFYGRPLGIQITSSST